MEDVYTATRGGALNEVKVPIEVKSTSSMSELSTRTQEQIRDVVWPKDIFGRVDLYAEVAHLLPTGKTSVMDWLHLGPAVLGIPIPNADKLEIRMKATLGFKEEGFRRRESGTGVLHFTSNKIRLQDQRRLMDDSQPLCLIIPVLTHNEARAWRGEGYKALFMLGLPGGPQKPPESYETQIDVPHNYKRVGLSDTILTKNKLTRDATKDEVETARIFLTEAVIALRHMIANLTDDDISATNCVRHDPLKQARFEARLGRHNVPRVVSEGPQDLHDSPRPVCLITFGDSGNQNMHPAPDPLLLVAKAANIWGKMTGMTMLANGVYDPYPDMTEEDYMAEMAYCEMLFGPSLGPRPQTREDLAAGLGQPNGYSSD